MKDSLKISITMEGPSSEARARLEGLSRSTHFDPNLRFFFQKLCHGGEKMVGGPETPTSHDEMRYLQVSTFAQNSENSSTTSFWLNRRHILKF